ncbi:MAG: TIGR01777 family protein [Bacteroidetes bacterium]|nr:MAG: TIGR01777 family protein [Bacteroidota bacterium]
MKIILAGGSGFIGRYIQKRFLEDGHVTCVLTRNPKQEDDVYWDGETLGAWLSDLDGADVLINLSGRSVDCRYNEKNKKVIYDSRLKSTAILGLALSNCTNPPKIWLNSSTATIYGHSEDCPMDDYTGKIGAGFSVDVARKWERTFFTSFGEGIRKVALRTAIVLGKEGGAYAYFKGLTKVGLGGFQGSGNQMVSWVHEEDVYGIIQFIIKEESIAGPINVTAPNPITNYKFMQAFRSVFKMSFGIPIFKWMLIIGAFVLRTEPELLLKSRWVIPKRLLNLGFEFKYSSVESAIRNLK